MATMTVDRYRELAHFFEAMSCDVRLRILEGLADHEHSVGQLCSLVGKQQQAVTHHLIIMKLCDVVQFRREGKKNLYSLTRKGREAYKVAASRLVA